MWVLLGIALYLEVYHGLSTMIITRSQSSFISQRWIDVGYICLKLTDTLTLVNCITYLSNVLQGFIPKKKEKTLLDNYQFWRPFWICAIIRHNKLTEIKIFNGFVFIS